MFHGYILLGIIGEGTYGQVYLASKGKTLDRPPWYEVNPAGSASLFAIKRQIQRKDDPNKKDPQVDETSFSVNLIREVKLLRELHHPNIVNLCETISEKNELSLVFEYAEYEMMKIIDFHKSEKKEIPEYTLKSFLYQSLKGVQYLHENWVIHRDLKPENILIIGEGPRRGCVVLADLGLARIFRNPILPLGQVDKVVVTLWYRAPELLLGAIDYTPAIDMWSMGCIFASLLLAKNPQVKALFQGRQLEKDENPPVQQQQPQQPNQPEKKSGPPFQIDQCEKIFQVLGLPNTKYWHSLPDYPRLPKDKQYPTTGALRSKFPGISETAYDLLSKLLNLDPTARITAAEALEHPYFTSTTPKPGDNSLDFKFSNGTSVNLKFPVDKPRAIDPELRKLQEEEISKKKEEIRRRYEAEYNAFHNPGMNVSTHKRQRIDAINTQPSNGNIFG